MFYYYATRLDPGWIDGWMTDGGLVVRPSTVAIVLVYIRTSLQSSPRIVESFK